MLGLALHRDIFKGDETAVRMILDAGVSPTVLSDGNNYTPLLTASDAGPREIARLLWHLVGPEGRSCPAKRTCLELAAENGHVDLVYDFLDMWDGWSTDEKCRALHVAARQWHDNVVSLLLAKVPYETDVVQAALNLSITRGPILPVALWVSRQPIITAEDDLRLQRVVCRLIDAGANPDARLRSLVPLLHVAAQSGHRIGALKGLLEKGADVNIQDKSGKTALHKLFTRPSPSMAALRALLQHGASPEMADETGETALHAVAYTGTLEQLQLCLPSCRDADAAIRLHTSHGELPLHYAAAGGREDIVEFLLSRGCNVDSANANGWTPLICTLMPTDVKSIYPKYSLASLLLQQGASAQVVTEEGWTALHGLASYPSTDRDLPPEKWEGVAPLVRELISRGAPLNTESSVLRSRSITRGTLIKSNAWGIRMRWFAQEAATSAPPESLEIVEDRDTTPHMWAYRTGAMEVFNTVLAHWGSVSEAER
jgi:ankyrin repeat protein